MDIHTITARQVQINHADDITPATPTGSIHPAQALDANGRAMKDKIGKHFDVHRPTDRSPGTPEQRQRRNEELNALQDDRAFKLQQAEFTPERLDKAEKNAAKLDLLVLTNIKAAMAGSPFAGLTLAGNLHPEMLSYNPQNTRLKEIAKQNTYASFFASLANVPGNRMMKDLKPTENLNPPDALLHAALQASRLEKRELHDKGLFGNSLDEAVKWGLTFTIRNFLLFYPLRTLLEHSGKAELAVAIENILRPMTALVAGVCIEQFNQYRDRQRDISGAAMLYGRRDAVPEGHEPKPIAEDHEWLDNLKNLEKADWLFSKATVKEFTDRVGKGAAGAAKSVLSGDFIKVIGEPENMLSEATLAAAFAAYGVAPAALRTYLEAQGYEPGEVAAIADAVKEALGALAFAAEAFMGVMGKGASEKAVDAVVKDDQFAKGVTKGLDKTAHLGAKGVTAISDGLVSGTKATGSGLATGGRFVGHAVSTGAEHLGNFASEQGRSLKDWSQTLTQRNPPTAGTTSATAPAGAIPMDTLAPQAAGSTPAPAQQPGGHDDMV